MIPMLVLHLEADTHANLTALAIKTLGIVAVERLAKADTAPLAEVLAEGAGNATLPAAQPRAPRKPRTSAAPAPLTTTPAVPPSAGASPATTAVPPAPQGSGNDAPAAAGLSTTAKVPTVDEVRYALSEVNGAFGMAACTDMLKVIGVDRVSLVPEAKRAEFIAACKAKLPAKAA